MDSVRNLYFSWHMKRNMVADHQHGYECCTKQFANQNFIDAAFLSAYTCY